MLKNIIKLLLKLRNIISYNKKKNEMKMKIKIKI